MGWDAFYRSVRNFTDRAAEKINRSADIAALQMKLAMAEKRLDDAYRTLGRIAYRHFTEEADHSEAVGAAVAEAEQICREIRALREQIASAKQRAAEADAANAAEERNEREAPTEPETTKPETTEPQMTGLQTTGSVPSGEAAPAEPEDSETPEHRALSHSAGAAAKSTAEEEETISGIEDEQ